MVLLSYATPTSHLETIVQPLAIYLSDLPATSLIASSEPVRVLSAYSLGSPGSSAERALSVAEPAILVPVYQREEGAISSCRSAQSGPPGRRKASLTLQMFRDDASKSNGSER